MGSTVLNKKVKYSSVLHHNIFLLQSTGYRLYIGQFLFYLFESRPADTYLLYVYPTTDVNIIIVLSTFFFFSLLLYSYRCNTKA